MLVIIQCLQYIIHYSKKLYLKEKFSPQWGQLPTLPSHVNAYVYDHKFIILITTIKYLILYYFMIRLVHTTYGCC